MMSTRRADDDDDREVFEQGLGICLRAGAITTIPLWLLATGAAWFGEPELAVVSCLATVPSFLAAAWVERSIDFTIVSSNGLIERDGQFNQRTLRWEDIRSAKLSSWLGAPVVVMQTEGFRTPIKLSLRHADEQRFRERIRRHTAPDHPLHAALDEHERSGETFRA